MTMDRKDLGLSLVSGTLLFFSFPKFGCGWLVWFALIPLFFALRKKSVREGFLLGGVAGVAWNLGLLYWVAEAVIRYGNLSLAAGWSVLLLLVIYMSLYVAVFSAVLCHFTGRGFPEIFAAPFLWTILEYGKSHLLTGFPWGNLGTALHEHLVVIQIADLAGVYGVSFVIVFVSTVLYGILRISQKNRRRIAGEMILCSLAVFVIVFYGFYRIEQVSEKMMKAEAAGVSVIQGNIEQAVKWNRDYQLRTLDVYERLTESWTGPETELVVWPETAMPFFLQEGGEKMTRILRLARETGADILLGSPSYRETGDGIRYGNSAFLVSPEGEITGKYDKVHLVPFGEYVPLEGLFSFMEKLVAGVGDFVPGEGWVPVEASGKPLGVLICYEGIFPGISRAYRTAGARLLVNITNDGWYGTSSAPYQHLASALFRAVENRVFLVRAANTGISAIISPTGEVVAKTGLFERTGLRGDVGLVDMGSPYSRYGDIFVYFCFVFSAIIFIYSLRRKRLND